jgi:hypothetical protein
LAVNGQVVAGDRAVSLAAAVAVAVAVLAVVAVVAEAEAVAADVVAVEEAVVAVEEAVAADVAGSGCLPITRLTSIETGMKTPNL